MEKIVKKKFLLKFSDIVKYVGDGARSYEEGERVYLANHLIFCGITKQFLNETQIFALCLKSTTPSNDIPYEINCVIINRTKFEVNITCKCACPAGLSGKCKHCVGLLYLLQS